MRNILLLLLFLVISAPGCAERLRASILTEVKLRIVGPLPVSQYVVHDQWGKEYRPDREGRLVIQVAAPHACDVYFLDKIKVQSAPEPHIAVEKGSKLVRSIRIDKLSKLPVDEKSYHILAIK